MKDPARWALEGGYALAGETPKYAAVHYQGSMNMGRAHGSPRMHVVMVDLEHDRQLYLKDLFRADYLKVVSAYCIAELRKNKDLRNYQIQSGAGPKAENYSRSYPVRDGLQVHFAAYQVGPYVLGPQRVLIPWPQLEGVMNRAELTRLGLLTPLP